MKFLFQPVIDTHTFYCDRINVQTHEGPKTFHAKVLNSIYDTLRKAHVMGMKQFNGICG